MRALRLMVAGLVAVAAMVAVLFAAVVVFFTGLVAYVLQLFGTKPGPAAAGRSSASNPRRDLRTDDAIDVVSTKVPDEPAER